MLEEENFMIKRLRKNFCLINIGFAGVISSMLLVAVFFAFYLACETVSLGLMKNVQENKLIVSERKITNEIQKPSRFLAFPFEFKGFTAEISNDGRLLSIEGYMNDDLKNEGLKNEGLKNEGLKNKGLKNESQIKESQINKSQINKSTINEDEAEIEILSEEEITELISSPKRSIMSLGGNSYRILKQSTNEGIEIVCYDRYDEIQFLDSLIILLIMFELLFLFFFSLLSFFIARWITKPVFESFEKQSQFISNASHEIKTPLTIILVNLDLLLEDEKGLSAKQSAYLKTIHQQSLHMNLLTKSLLNLARLERKERRIDLEEIDISKITLNAALSFEAVLFENQKQMTIKVDDEIAVKITKEDFERLCFILLDNAVKFCSEKGKVYISLKKRRNKVTLAVENDYTGEILMKEQIYERFYKGDSQKESFGLGLSLAKEICEKNKMILNYQEKDEKVKFTVTKLGI